MCFYFQLFNPTFNKFYNLADHGSFHIVVTYLQKKVLIVQLIGRLLSKNTVDKNTFVAQHFNECSDPGNRSFM